MKKVILIPNDANVYILLVSILLRKMGFSVKSFRTDKDVMETALAVSPDMVFLDKGITGMDCAQALRSLKADERTAALPVVVISSDLTETNSDEFLSLGAESYMMMPVSIREMHEILERCLYIPHGYHRDFLRVSFCGRIMLTQDGIGEWLYSETLSERGIYIRKRYPYPVGSLVVVSIPLIEEHTVSIEGRVKYIVYPQEHERSLYPAMAIEFLDDNLDSLVVVSNYVEGLLTIPADVNIQNISCGL